MSKSRMILGAFVLGVLVAASVPASASYIDVVQADSPYAFWQLNEGNGTTAVDSSTNPGGHNGEYDHYGVGSPTLGAAGIPGGGTAASFNGINNQAYISTPGYYATAYTLEAWVKADAGATTSRNILCKGVGDLTNDYSGQLLINSAGHFETYDYAYGTGLNGYMYVGGTTVVQPGQWYHVVAWYNPGQPDGAESQAIYVNGVKEASFAGWSASNPWNYGNDGRWGIGALTGKIPSTRGIANWFQGEIADVAIYNSVLSDGQILAHYNAGITPVPEPGAMTMLAGLFGLLAYAWRRRK